MLSQTRKKNLRIFEDQKNSFSNIRKSSSPANLIMIFHCPMKLFLQFDNWLRNRIQALNHQNQRVQQAMNMAANAKIQQRNRDKNKCGRNTVGGLNGQRNRVSNQCPLFVRCPWWFQKTINFEVLKWRKKKQIFRTHGTSYGKNHTSWSYVPLTNAIAATANGHRKHKNAATTLVIVMYLVAIARRLSVYTNFGQSALCLPAEYTHKNQWPTNAPKWKLRTNFDRQSIAARRICGEREISGWQTTSRCNIVCRHRILGTMPLWLFSHPICWPRNSWFERLAL